MKNDRNHKEVQTRHDPTIISITGDNTNTVYATLSVAVPWVTNGNVNAMVQDTASHRLYVGGAFTNVGGVTRNNIAHIINDYSDDPTFNPNAKATVNTLAINGSTIYAGGSFTTIGNLPSGFFSIITQ